MVLFQYADLVYDLKACVLKGVLAAALIAKTNACMYSGRRMEIKKQNPNGRFKLLAPKLALAHFVGENGALTRVNLAIIKILIAF